MALTTKSVSPLTHFNQDYYNNLKRNVSFAEAEKYRLKVTKARPKAINLGKKWAFSKLTEWQIRWYDEQNKLAQEQKEQREKDIATGKIKDLGKLPEEQEENKNPQDPPADPNENKNDPNNDPEVQTITREEVIKLLKDNDIKVAHNIWYEKAIIKAQDAWLL